MAASRSEKAAPAQQGEPPRGRGDGPRKYSPLSAPIPLDALSVRHILTKMDRLCSPLTVRLRRPATLDPWRKVVIGILLIPAVHQKFVRYLTTIAHLKGTIEEHGVDLKGGLDSLSSGLDSTSS